MAFTVTARQSGNLGTGPSQSTGFTTSSATPTASSLFLVAFGVENDSNTGTHAPQTPTGGSLSYASVGSVLQIPWATDPTFAICQAMYRADVGGSPSAFAVSVDAYASAVFGYYAACCVDITGHNTTTPIVQSKTAGATVSPTSDTATGTVTFDSAVTSGNLIVVSFYASADTGGAFTAPTAGGGNTFTEHFNQNNSGYSHMGIWTRVATGGESTTITCTDLGNTTASYTAIAVEIADVGGGGGGPAVPTPYTVTSGQRWR